MLLIEDEINRCDFN